MRHDSTRVGLGVGRCSGPKPTAFGEGHDPEVAGVESGLPCLGLAKFSKVKGRDRPACGTLDAYRSASNPLVVWVSTLKHISVELTDFV